MKIMTFMRRLRRWLPISPAALLRLRRVAGVAFRIAALAKVGLLRRQAAPGPGPVCVVGFHGSVLGLGEAVRGFSAALRLAGAEVVDWDISALFGHDVRLDTAAACKPPDSASSMVVFLNPLEFVQLLAMTGGAPFRGRYCVGFWFWEQESAPKSWRSAMRYVDEVWTASRFVAGAVAARAPAELTIRVLPCPLLSPTARPNRARFGLADDKVVVLTAFDVRSGFERKNPHAAVRAFRRANTDGRAVMVCKAAGIEGSPAQIQALRAQIGSSNDVQLMTDWLTGAEMASLIASADIILSLHRSEGFGLLPAQGMASGKAVVATGWSGNLDFMGDEDSALVDYSLIPVNDPQGLYSGGLWAEPDVEDAAAKLAEMINDPDRRHAIGARAAAAIARKLDPLVIGRQAHAWLGHGVGAESPGGS